MESSVTERAVGIVISLIEVDTNKIITAAHLNC